MDNNVHIPFITLKFGSTSLSWRFNEVRPDYFTSLRHKRITGKASEMEINITYAPRPDEDPNTIEKAIIGAKGECLVQYGDLNQTSPYYKGMILGYTVSINEGVLAYTIKIISSVVCYRFEKVPGKNFSSNDKTPADVEKLIESIVNNFMTSSISSTRSYKYVSKINFNDKVTFDTISIPSGPPMTALEGIVQQLKVKSSWASDKKNTGSTSLINSGYNRYDPKNDKFEMLAYGDGSNPPDRSLQYYLALDVNDEGSNGRGPGEISVILVDRNEVPEDEYKFEWGSKDGEVISWSPEFDGTISIYTFEEDQTDSMIKLNRDSSGFVTVASKIPDLKENSATADLFEQLENKQINESETIKEYEYKATLTVLGKSKMMSLGKSTIQVTPLLAGQAHHSAGRYIVIGVEDNVSSSGFTTTYTLYRASDDVNLYGKSVEGSRVYADGDYVELTDYDVFGSEPTYSYGSIGNASNIGNALKPRVVDGATWLTPISWSRFASPFGMRLHPISGEYKMHNGVDLSAAGGTPIYATRGGTVTISTYGSSGGYWIRISHPSTKEEEEKGYQYQSEYMHMKEPSRFKVGDTVQAGWLIGYCDSTGSSTGDHLHFGVLRNWTYVNPVDYIDVTQE